MVAPDDSWEAGIAKLAREFSDLRAGERHYRNGAMLLLKRLGGSVVITREEILNFDPTTTLESRTLPDGGVELRLKVKGEAKAPSE